MRGGLFFQLGTPSGLSQSPSLFTGKPPPAQALEESLGEGVTVVAAHWEVTVWIPPSLAARHRLQCSLDRGGGRGGGQPCTQMRSPPACTTCPCTRRASNRLGLCSAKWPSWRAALGVTCEVPRPAGSSGHEGHLRASSRGLARPHSGSPGGLWPPARVQSALSQSDQPLPTAGWSSRLTVARAEGPWCGAPSSSSPSCQL